MTTIVLYDRDTRITYTNDAEAERALSEHLGCPVTIAEVQAAAVASARRGTSGYPAVTHRP